MELPSWIGYLMISCSVLIISACALSTVSSHWNKEHAGDCPGAAQRPMLLMGQQIPWVMCFVWWPTPFSHPDPPLRKHVFPWQISSVASSPGALSKVLFAFSCPRWPVGSEEVAPPQHPPVPKACRRNRVPAGVNHSPVSVLKGYVFKLLMWVLLSLEVASSGPVWLW